MVNMSSEKINKKKCLLFVESPGKCPTIKKYLNDTALQKAVSKVDHWIGIDGWIKTYNKNYSKSLFE